MKGIFSAKFSFFVDFFQKIEDLDMDYDRKLDIREYRASDS